MFAGPENWKRRIWKSIREWSIFGGMFLAYQIRGLSFVGVITGAFFFAISLSPSLLPRPLLFQCVLSSFAIATGYGVGVSILGAWRFLDIPQVPQQRLRMMRMTAGIPAAAGCAVALVRTTEWQNSIRALMEMPSVETTYPVSTLLLSVGGSIFLIFFGRGIRRVSRIITRRLNRFLPVRIAWGTSVVVIYITTVFIANGVVGRWLLSTADDIFRQADRIDTDDTVAPERADMCGGPESRIAWATIGRRGKQFLTQGPTKEEIADFWNQPSRSPIRVYSGMLSAEDDQQRAELALQELQRLGGFERRILVIATPTGTGWLDPGAVDTLEYLHRGDTAIVSMQYSYLPSWITILVDPQRSIASAETLFRTVYSYWRSLPRETRPRLYLHGLSLGALGSEVCADLYTILEDPIQGAVWSGPPFPSRQWKSLTQSRTHNSPAWLPRIADGAIVRFTGQENSLHTGQSWGVMRNVYIQYASDPMVFFSPDLLYRRPDWLNGVRGPDVSPELSWYPLVTFLKIGFDLPVATRVPHGYGHNYAPQSYIDAWVAVTEPEGWIEERRESLAGRIRLVTP